MVESSSSSNKSLEAGGCSPIEKDEEDIVPPELQFNKQDYNYTLDVLKKCDSELKEGEQFFERLHQTIEKRSLVGDALS